MKKLLSVLLAALMCFGVFSGALAEGVNGTPNVTEVTEVDAAPTMIETDLPSGIYDDGRTLIVHPEDGDMFFDYDPDAVYTSSTGTRDAASAAELDAALNIYGDDFEFDNTVSSYPWEVSYDGGRYCARSSSQSVSGAYSSFTLTVNCRAGQQLAFDYCTYHTTNSIQLYVNMDGSQILSVSDNHPSWDAFTKEVSTSGIHVFEFGFLHYWNGSSSYACIDNIRLTSNTIGSPMMLPFEFDDLLQVNANGFLAEIEPPMDGAIPVSDAKQLYDIRNNSQGNYYLTCDINVSDLELYGITWTSIPEYSGVFDGQGHSISTLPETLFAQAYGTIKNLSVTVDISSYAYSTSSWWGETTTLYCGSIVAYVPGTLDVSNCVVNGRIETPSNTDGYSSGTVYVGGITGGGQSVPFSYCINDVCIDVSCSQNKDCYVGGIAGGNGSLFNDCLNKADLRVTSLNNVARVGGLSGNGGTFTGCMNNGNVIATAGNSGSSYAGGMSGLSARISNCVNNAAITAIANGSGASYAGGMSGISGNTISNCYVDGRIQSCSDGGNSYAGGLYGYYSNSMQVSNLYIVTNSICAETDAENCYAYVGGIAGYVNADANIGYCLTNAVDGSAYDSWHVMKGSIVGYVVNKLTLSDTCAFNNLNSFAGYYGSIEGRDNAVPYNGDLIVKNANYTIKVVDAQTGGPIPNALVNCDGYKMTTDAFGMARFTLPVNVMIQITASKSLYAPTTAFATRLSSNGINTMSLRYVGDGNSGGSGSGSGSGGGFSGGVNVAGYSFSMPGAEAATVTATGPNGTIHGKTSSAFKVELGMDMPYSKLTVKFDPEKQTVKIIINAKISAEYGSDGYEAKFDNKYNSIMDNFDKLLTGRDKDKWRSDFEAKQARFGLSGEVTFGGFAEISLASGKAELVKGGVALGMKSKYNTPKYPLWGLIYWQLEFSGGVSGEYKLNIGQGNVLQWPGETSVSLGITGKVGVGDILGLVKAETGLKVKGKITITTPFVSMESSVKAKANIDWFAEFKALLWSDEVSKTLKEWQIWPKQKDITEIDFTPYMRNDAMKLISREYLNSTGEMRAIGDESLIMNSVFPYGEPQLVQLDDGRLVLVWVHDDGTRTDENRTALYYSTCDNGEWSEPAIVWDDGTADFSPVIAADGNNVHIVWQNVSEVLPEGATIDTAITKTQICYTKLNWDGSIAAPYVVDTAGRYQANICMAAENGNVIVAWKENSSNNIWNETGSYYPYYCKMQNGSWSSPYYYTSYSLITEMACGFVDGQPSYAFVNDIDGNATTVTDLEVYRVYPNSSNSPTRLSNNSVVDCNIQYVNNDLYWRQDNELRNAGGTLGLNSEDGLTLAVTPDGSLVAVIKSVVDGFNTELYGSFQNAEGEWSVPAPITNYYGAIRSFSPIVCEDGSIAIALDNAELQEIEQDGDEAYGTTSMYVIVGSSLTDLIVTSGMMYDVDEVTPGEDLPMTVSVYNNSINAVNGVKAEFYDANNELVCTLNSDDVVECGEEKEITFSYPVPAELALTEYTVKVLPASVDDDIPDNNGTSVTIGYADVAIENGRFNRTETGATVEADITNSGFTAAENVVVSLCYQGIDGDFLGSIELGNLAAGASEHASFNIPTTYLENSDELDLNTFYLYIETDTEEAHAYNNSETIVDEPIRVTDISLDIHEKDMLVHETLQLTATIMPLDAANQLVRWASTNVDVATVDENGLVTCVGEGTATIYAISADGIFSEGCVINAEYPYYTVTFLDDDGTVLKTEQVKETDDATPPDVADRVGWSFVGWDGDYTNISGDTTLTAQYQINTYHVIYYINGEVYHTDEFEYGAEITPLDEPEIEGYTFMGWDYIPEVMPAEDVIVTGEVEINSYRLNYYVDGTFYQRVTYEYGAAITPLEEPTREDYVFSGWSEIPETMPAHNVSVYGTFSIMTFTVTFVDWDDTVIDVQEVEIHADAVAPADPVRTGYSFAGWDGDFTAVTEDVTVKATYKINEYTVTFKDWDGTVLSEQTIEYGASAIAPEIPERAGYTFTGWDVDFSCIEDDTVVTAQYINNAEIKYYEKTEAAELTSGYYVVYGVNGDYCGAMNNTLSSNRMGLTDVEIVDDRIQNPDETIVWYIEVGEDGVITLYNEASEKYVEITINNASGFSLATEPTCGYTYEFDEVTGTYLLQSTSETGGDRCISIYQTDFRCLTSGGAKELYLYKMANNHTVTFVDWNGTVLAVQRVEDGAAATPPEEPEREGYTFTGWDTEFENVTEDIVVTAQYSINSYTLTINYLYEDGTVASETYSAEFEYGASYSIASPEIEGFTADTPVVEGNMGAEDTVVNVTYISNTPAFIPGDVNGDGEVNASDAILIMRYALGIIELTDQQLLAADVNGDGEVNASDAIIIMRKALGIIA